MCIKKKKKLIRSAEQCKRKYTSLHQRTAVEVQEYNPNTKHDAALY
jgi:hypothetical protein